MTVYDFDNTVYDGESTFDFFMFCLARHPSLVRYLFALIRGLYRYKRCKVSREELLRIAEKNMFGMLRSCPDYATLAEKFWDKNMKKIKPFYLAQKQKDDVILSASFGFLLRPCIRRLGVENLVCSEADLENCEILQLCFRENKPKIFDQAFPEAVIDAFYTDSENDMPFIKRAAKSYFVRGNTVSPIADY